MKIIKGIVILVLSIVLFSCDQEFNTIGADLVGDEHFDFNTHVISGLKAYTKATGDVQTNNLPINPLGIYNNPVFGETKSNFVTHLAMSSSQPNFGTSVQVENITLYIPYYSTLTTTNSDGSKEYTLDSIYSKNDAGKTSKMKLSVYENGGIIDALDPADNLQSNLKYFTDGSANNTIIDFENLKRGNDGSGNSVQNGTRLNDSPNTAENDQFFFNKAEIVVYKTKFNTTTGVLEYLDANDVVTTDPTKYVVKERLAPGIYLTLNKTYFKKRILDAASTDLISNKEFRNYFKGLFFKVEQVSGETGAMAMINFNNAKLNVNYSSVDDGAATGTAATSKTFLLYLGTNSSGNTVSLQNFSPSSNYVAGLSASSSQTTDNTNLYLKGGNGSMAFIEIPDTEITTLKQNNWLINDAYLEFYVDKSKMAANTKYQEPERLYLYDATNHTALVDYTFDASTSTNSKRNKLVFGGIVERDDTSDKKAVRYKIRITQHINNLLNSTNENLNKNVKLGLCVTESIAYSNNFYYFKNPLTFSSGVNINYFPTPSIMAQQGVVLYGTDVANSDKKLKLTIHYTKPN